MGRLTKLALSITIAVAVGSASYAAAQQGNQPAEQKWTGNISDAMCGVSHGANGGDMTKDHDCAVKCAKGGSAYVFVADKKIFKIADQKMPDLERHAGHRVEITGTLKNDTITVSKVTMLK
ncbi:MAG TPA: hypothetical protein VFO19_13590 [Vicinamibacterales bacterium]|jgi:hypothetical protein|nr:hypothetical protein [Vicinamibacterales bacterium]